MSDDKYELPVRMTQGGSLRGSTGALTPEAVARLAFIAEAMQDGKEHAVAVQAWNALSDDAKAEYIQQHGTRS